MEFPSRLTPRRVKSLNGAAVLLALLFLAGIPLFSSNFQPRDDAHAGPYAGDFLQEYLGGYLILHGDRACFYDRDYAIALQHDPAVMGMGFDEQQFLPIIYPPFYYLLAVPFALLPFRLAALLWLLLMAAFFAATLFILRRAHPQNPALLAWTLPAAIFFAPLVENFVSSQKATLLLLILTTTYFLLDKRKPFWAGVVFGLLAFKPQLTLVIALAMLCKRQGWFVLGGLVTGSVLLGLSLAIGPEVCLQYLEVSRNMAEYINMSGFQHEKMHCWYGFFKLLLAGSGLGVIQAATVVATLVTIAVLARLLRGPLSFGQPEFALQYSGLVVATILLSPHLLTYDLSVLLLPLILLTIFLLDRPSESGPEGKRLAVLLVLLYILCGISTTLAHHIRLQLTVPVMFVLLVGLWRTRGVSHSTR